MTQNTMKLTMLAAGECILWDHFKKRNSEAMYHLWKAQRNLLDNSCLHQYEAEAGGQTLSSGISLSEPGRDRCIFCGCEPHPDPAIETVAEVEW